MTASWLKSPPLTISPTRGSSEPAPARARVPRRSLHQRRDARASDAVDCDAPSGTASHARPSTRPSGPGRPEPKMAFDSRLRPTTGSADAVRMGGMDSVMAWYCLMGSKPPPAAAWARIAGGARV